MNKRAKVAEAAALAEDVLAELGQATSVAIGALAAGILIASEIHEASEPSGAGAARGCDTVLQEIDDTLREVAPHVGRGT